MDLIGQRQHMIRLPDVTGPWLSQHALEVPSQHDSIQAALKKQYAAFAAIYAAQLSRMIELFEGAGDTSGSKSSQTIHPRRT